MWLLDTNICIYLIKQRPRQVLDRLEDSATGRLLPASFHCEVPAERFKSPMKVADIPRLFTPETFCKLVLLVVTLDVPLASGPDSTFFCIRSSTLCI